MSWQIHDRLAPHMTATSDCETAYRLGVMDAYALREIAADDLDAVAAKCAAKGAGAHPQKTAFERRPNRDAGRLRAHGALD